MSLNDEWEEGIEEHRRRMFGGHNTETSREIDEWLKTLRALAIKGSQEKHKIKQRHRQREQQAELIEQTKAVREKRKREKLERDEQLRKAIEERVKLTDEERALVGEIRQLKQKQQEEKKLQVAQEKLRKQKDRQLRIEKQIAQTAADIAIAEATDGKVSNDDLEVIREQKRAQAQAIIEGKRRTMKLLADRSESTQSVHSLAISNENSQRKLKEEIAKERMKVSVSMEEREKELEEALQRERELKEKLKEQERLKKEQIRKIKAEELERRHKFVAETKKLKEEARRLKQEQKENEEKNIREQKEVERKRRERIKQQKRQEQEHLKERVALLRLSLNTKPETEADRSKEQGSHNPHEAAESGWLSRW